MMTDGDVYYNQTGNFEVFNINPLVAIKNDQSL